MKNLLITLTLLIPTTIFSAIDTIKVKSKITDVTVFYSGAQITRSSNLKLNKGKYLIKVDNLPQELNPQSIQVKAFPNCKILSIKQNVSYQNEGKKGTDEIIFEKKIDAQELKIKEINNKLQVFDLEERILLGNSDLEKKEGGSSIATIKEAADFYRLRLNEIRQGKLTLFTELELIKKESQELYLQLNELTANKRKNYCQVLITLEFEKEASGDLTLSYYILSAGWEPLYDFRVDDITQPLVIVYNANVYQSSGENWNNVNIKLSTNNPSLSGNEPKIITWYVERPSPYQNKTVVAGKPSALKGRVLDAATNEALAFANVAIYQGNELIATVTTDINGQYTIKPIPSGAYSAKVIYLGYNPAQINYVNLTPDKTTSLDFKLQVSAVAMQEVQVTEYAQPLIDPDTKSGSTVYREHYTNLASKSINSVAATSAGVYNAQNSNTINVRGNRSDETVVYIDGVKQIGTPRGGVETTNYISNSLKTSVTNLEYTIEIPYTIPSDGQDYSLKIKEASLPVNYIYHAVPKLDNDVFLSAHIPNWIPLNLLSGKSSIYYQGTFTGESYIDVNNVSDTLRISLGRDQNIIVKRVGNKEMFDKRISSNSIRETIGWDITVKNNRNAKIKIIVQDQYPISQRKSIEVELLESSAAKIDTRTGKLSWELELEPNEKKIFSYKYSVKYPRDSGLRVD